MKNFFNKNILLLILMGLLFSGAYSQLPLFTSNQNQYFLQGLAKSGYGYLISDWLVAQTDTVPVFTTFVYLVNMYGSHLYFYLTFIILATIYAVSLLLVGTYQYTKGIKTIFMAPILVVLVLFSNDWISNLLNNISGLSRFAYLFSRFGFFSTNGVANQYVMSPYLQPSSFGILLITSIALYLNKKPYFAIISAVLAATVHTSLILHSGILVFSFMLCSVLEKKIHEAIKLGVLALLLILPILVYTTNNFLFSDTQIMHTIGNEISVFVRQPHHAIISYWFGVDGKAIYFQLGIVLTGLILSYRSKRLFIILFTCASTSFLLSIIQLITGNLTLALLFPWRTSAWLIPVCTTIIISSILSGVHRFFQEICNNHFLITFKNSLSALSLGLLLVLFFLGINNTISNIIQNQPESRLMVFAKENANSFQTYLIPTDIETFRLCTGVPIFIDWKSCPHRSRDVIEWNKRIILANDFYEASNASQAAFALSAIQKESNITHIIVEVEKKYLLDKTNADSIFRDDKYIVFQVDS